MDNKNVMLYGVFAGLNPVASTKNIRTYAIIDKSFFIDILKTKSGSNERLNLIAQKIHASIALIRR